ncbi:MAG: SMC-Scp complex subunit ScpB [Calditrichaceae bacterium]|nr:SMC-Scp complex subunit ScpB [Calditrichaceae bacterium]MBN2708920.1 SMC-Scp complex subunit ScpB [Calditrichaceae bacterium]RQV97556.1 MAG: SMC-Scp complex subunit ScpB [Calditrichota bacterium]
MSKNNLNKQQKIIECLIFANDGPLPARKIIQIIGQGTEKQIQEQVGVINSKYTKADIPYEIIEVAGGYQMVSKPDYSDWITKLYASRSTSRLTQRALETLAIIAYKQPITKQEMESIRGVNVDGVIRTLIERNLITVTGREKAPGNPLLYGTTKFFLEYFGLNSLEDMPQLKEIDELLKSDEKFLESLDQVSLQQMLPEDLGIASMIKDKTTKKDNSAETEENIHQDKQAADAIQTDENEMTENTDDAS